MQLSQLRQHHQVLRQQQMVHQLLFNLVKVLASIAARAGISVDEL